MDTIDIVRKKINKLLNSEFGDSVVLLWSVSQTPILRFVDDNPDRATIDRAKSIVNSVVEMEF